MVCEMECIVPSGCIYVAENEPNTPVYLCIYVLSHTPLYPIVNIRIGYIHVIQCAAPIKKAIIYIFNDLNKHMYMIQELEFMEVIGGQEQGKDV